MPLGASNIQPDHLFQTTLHFHHQISSMAVSANTSLTVLCHSMCTLEQWHPDSGHYVIPHQAQLRRFLQSALNSLLLLKTQLV